MQSYIMLRKQTRERDRQTCKAGDQADRRCSWEFLDQDSSDRSRAAWKASCCSPPATFNKGPKDYNALHVPLCLSVP